MSTLEEFGSIDRGYISLPNLITRVRADCCIPFFDSTIESIEEEGLWFIVKLREFEEPRRLHRNWLDAQYAKNPKTGRMEPIGYANPELKVGEKVEGIFNTLSDTFWLLRRVSKEEVGVDA